MFRSSSFQRQCHGGSQRFMNRSYEATNLIVDHLTWFTLQKHTLHFRRAWPSASFLAFDYFEATDCLSKRKYHSSSLDCVTIKDTPRLTLSIH